MNLVAEGVALRGDAILSTVERSDLSPIPRTLEATLRWDADIFDIVQEGKLIEAGPERNRFRVARFERLESNAGTQGGRPVAAMKITALMDEVHQVAFQRSRAVVFNSQSLGAIYRACGATVKVGSDFVIPRFSVFVGDVPTPAIAIALQEEGGVLRVKPDSSIEFVRIPDLFKQDVIATIPEDAPESVQSQFEERHSIPFFYSVNASGALIFGDRQSTRTAMFVPRKTERELRLMTKVLIRRNIVTLPYNPGATAGQLIKVGGKDLVIITAAHAYFSGADGEGNEESYSRFWVGDAA